MVKFELLADRDDKPFDATFCFHNCEHLDTANLQGTKYAAEDIEVRTLSAKVEEDRHTIEINVTGVAGFLLAKCAATHSRCKTKDWYDIAFVLLHNDPGGPATAADAVIEKFGDVLGASRTVLDDLAAVRRQRGGGTQGLCQSVSCRAP